MTILSKFHVYFERKVPPENKTGLETVALVCAFVYTIVPAYIIYIIPSEEVLSAGHVASTQLITFLDGFWWLFLIGAVSCGFLWHFFHNTSTVKRSLATGVSLFLFSHLLIVLGLIWSLFTQTRALL